VGWRVAADVERFDEAVESFLRRVPLTDAQRRLIPIEARRRAFWIAGTAQMDVLQHAIDSIRDAIADGTSLEDWKVLARERLGAEFATATPSHLTTVFRNATQTAYNEGRYEQMMEPAVVQMRPFWMYDAILDGATTEICRDLNSKVVAANDPFWDSHTPPLHHNCRSSIRSLKRSEALQRGISSKAPDIEPQEGFGQSPKVSKDWKPDLRTKDAELRAELKRKHEAYKSRPDPDPLPAA
jgi:SPP1 gp7 family putative phage head morphogenesis protein